MSLQTVLRLSLLVLIWAGIARSLLADSVVYLHNGSIYIGKQVPLTKEDKDVVILKTDLGIIRITKGKIIKIIEDETSLPEVSYKDDRGEKTVQGRLLGRRDNTTLILSEGKVKVVDNVRVDDGKPADLKDEKRESAPKTKSWYLGAAGGMMSFPFSKIRKDTGAVAPDASRPLWGLKIEGAYFPVSMLGLELSSGYYRLLEKDPRVPFGTTDRVTAIQQDLSLFNFSTSIFCRFWHSYAGIGASYNRQSGNIKYSYIKIPSGIHADKTIRDRKGFFSLSLHLRQEISVTETFMIVPGLELARHFISTKKIPTFDPGFSLGLRLLF